VGLKPDAPAIGVVLPTSGAVATKGNIVAVAQKAEALGLASVWVFHRLLYPLESSNEHPFLRGGSAWPKVFQSVLDPLQSLALAAAHTSTVRLGTCVVNMPYYAPAVLAKEVATLDVLSEGRVDFGVGIGWSLDELTAVGVEPQRRGKRGDEYIRCLRTIWNDEVVQFDGDFYQVPRSRIEPKPLQGANLPLLIGGYSAAGIRRAVTYGDGYIVGAVPIERLVELLDALAQQRQEMQRNDESFRIVSRVEVAMEQPSGDRSSQAAAEALGEKLGRYRDLGVTEVYLDFNQGLAAAEEPAAAMDLMLEILDVAVPALDW
jgi:probable F420-dependent oxidoreductase